MVVNFYGDNNSKVVHDTNNEKSECEFMLVHKRYFIPDTLEQAKSEGFTNCEYCIKIDKPKLDTKKQFEESNKARDRIVIGSKAKAKTKEVRSSKKIATVRKQRG